ncbi:hypothetical protein [Mariniplasma anaerobium]|uniref:Peptidase S24/S26A/S26B/S26C domain-containing protein n=1 Tax=Mariniplasma anaerobium TaxID=2735436 RepID=A0A7U9XVU0_9MOLU|nr:hypothetical protein [Mariniplasma anaerobium]BCR35467.1 hypothetical protein MPAN_003600 [Mariniplasma anaerobium]
MPLIKELLEHNQSVKFKISGTSMLPFFKHQETLVTLIRKDAYKKYDAILYQVNDAFVLHRIIKVDREFYLTCGDALKTIELVDKSNVLGYVSMFEYKDKLIHSNDKAYMFKVKVWHCVKPFRRILLKLIKRK